MEGGPPMFRQDFTCPALLKDLCALSHTGLSPILPDFPDRSATHTKATGLFRVRSPLLAESLLMSFPPGTEMFQFPGFASTHYVFMCRSSFEGVAPFGYPRIKACSRLPMAFRSVPRPSSPPDAKASTECSYHALGRASHDSPQRTDHSCQKQKITASGLCARHTMHRNKTRFRGQPTDDNRSVLTENCSLYPVPCLTSLIDTAVMEPCSHTDIRSDKLTTARPETHQNLIHTNKDQQQPTTHARRHTVEER